MRRLHPAILVLFVVMGLCGWVSMIQHEIGAHKKIQALGEKLDAGGLPIGGFITTSTLHDSQVTFTDGPGGKLRVSASLPGEIVVCLDPSPCLLLREVRALVAGKVGQ